VNCIVVCVSDCYRWAGCKGVYVRCVVRSVSMIALGNIVLLSFKWLLVMYAA
jgi:hypothetical protein